MLIKEKEIKIGVFLSYLLIAVNMLYSLFVTPYILRYIGESAYGVYKTISSISASLVIMDLGFSSTMTRYIAKYNATGEKEKAQNFAGMIFAQLFILEFIIMVVGFVLYILIPSFYGKTFSDSELSLAKDLLIILVINIMLRMLENLFFGILNGYERFIFSNSARLINIILKLAVIAVLLPLVKNVKLVVLAETALVTLTIIVFSVYFRIVLKFKPKLKKWDFSLFKESFGYTFLMFIQSITVQFNGNVDNMLIGAMQGPGFVTIYSMAIAIFSMYENLSGSIANIMLPRVTQKVVNGAGSQELQKVVEKTGKYQFALLAAALGGFIVLGKDFYNLWVGSSFKDCYYLTLILIIPVTFPMIQNVALSILRAKNKMLYRTVTLMFSCLFNIIVTFVGIKFFGYWGAAVGTAGATVLNLIMMNIYYKMTLNFKIAKMFFNIMSKVLPAAFIAVIMTWIISNVFHGTWFTFVVSAAIFITVYGIFLTVFGFDPAMRNIWHKIAGRRK